MRVHNYIYLCVGINDAVTCQMGIVTTVPPTFRGHNSFWKSLAYYLFWPNIQFCANYTAQG